MSQETNEIEKEIEPQQEVQPTPAEVELERTRKALQKANKEAEHNRLELKKLKEQFGSIDLEEINKIKQEREEAELAAAEKRGEFEKFKQQLVESKAKELAAKDAELQKMKASVESLVVDREILTTLDELNGKPKLLLGKIKQHTKLQQDEAGNFKAIVLDDDNTTRYNADGKPMSIKEFVAELKSDPDYAVAFGSSVKAGSGVQAGNKPSGAGKAPTKGLSKSAMTMVAKSNYIETYGFEAYQSLPK